MNNELELGSIPAELSLLIQALESESATDRRELDQQTLTTIDWERVRVLSHHHRVFPVLFQWMKKQNLKRMVPEHVWHALSYDYQRNTMQMLRLCGELRHIAEHASHQGIRMIFLKGPMLTQELYGEYSLRTCGDLDLLVELSQLAQTEKLMYEFGYVKDDYFSTVLNDWKWRHHHTSFFHPDKKIKVEVHWRLNPGPSIEPTFEDMWIKKRTGYIAEQPVYLLGYEDLLLFLVMHGSRHGWSRLRWLQDIDRLLHTRMVDPQMFQKLLKKHRCTHLAGQSLWLCEQLLHTEIPEPYRKLMRSGKSKRLAQQALFYVRKMINLHDYPLPADVDRYHKRYLFTLMSGRQKLLYVLSFLYPYPEDVELLPLPRKLHFFYFPLRPFLWVWRKTMGKHA